jgi:hypothetical protein
MLIATCSHTSGSRNPQLATHRDATRRLGRCRTEGNRDAGHGQVKRI